MKRKKRKREQKKQDTNVGVLKYLWSIMMKTISIKKQINNDENNLNKKKIHLDISQKKVHLPHGAIVQDKPLPPLFD